MTIVTSTLDSFDRPDAPTLGPNWSPKDAYPAPQRLAISSNTCVSTVGPLFEWWNPQMFGPDVEFGLDLAGDTIGTSVYICVRMPSAYPGVAPPDWPFPWNMYALGYRAAFAGTTVTLSTPSGAIASPASFSLRPAASGGGGAVKIRAEGSTITASYRYDPTSSWVDAVVATNTEYTDAGYIGMQIDLTGSTSAFAGDAAPPPPETGPIDINRRLLTVASATVEAIDLNSPLYH